ncbi:MAG: hypothetical protein ABSH06_22700 [Thermodesulfobacteriota bacterium]
MADFNVSHGLFISAFFADEIPKRLWKLIIAFFICPKTSGIQLGREVVCPDRIQIGLDNPIDYCYLEI